MRPLPILVLAAVATAAPASAATRDEHQFTMKLSKSSPATSTGVSFRTDRFAYLPPQPGQPADRVARTVFVLPPGTRTDTGAVPNCKASALVAQGAAGCPAGTRVGSGTASAITGLKSIDPIPEKVTIYASRKGLLAHLTGLQTAVIELSMRGNRITADVPRNCLPPGTLADGCSNGEAVLKTLAVKIRARRKGRRMLIRTPRTCPATGVWTNRAIYTYVNGDSETKTTTTRCSR